MAGLVDWWMRPVRPNAHAAPDYADHSEAGPWAAWPTREGPATLQPEGEPPVDGGALACDCFYVHPTCFGILHNLTGSWNSAAAPLADPVADRILQHNLATQASAFSRSCRIFAPRYRQMALGGFFPGRDDGDRAAALDVAYADVKAAFLHFLEARGDPSRPFVIASHSQGTMHCGRLVLECVEGTAVAKSLVCAYLVGFLLPRDCFGVAAGGKDLALHVAAGPEDTQCVLGYDTLPSDAPVGTLGRDEAWRARFGAHFLRDASGGVARTRTVGMERLAVIPGAAAHRYRGCLLPKWGWLGQVLGLQRAAPRAGAPARVEARGDYVAITPAERWWPGAFLPWMYRMRSFGSYHAVDFALFWFDLREDVAARLAAWQRRAAGAAPPRPAV